MFIDTRLYINNLYNNNKNNNIITYMITNRKIMETLECVLKNF